VRREACRGRSEARVIHDQAGSRARTLPARDRIRSDVLSGLRDSRFHKMVPFAPTRHDSRLLIVHTGHARRDTAIMVSEVPAPAEIESQ